MKNFNRKWTRKLSHCQKTGTLGYILRHIGILRAKCFDQFLKGRFITATSKGYDGTTPWSILATRALGSVYTSAVVSWLRNHVKIDAVWKCLHGTIFARKSKSRWCKRGLTSHPNSISLTIVCTIREIPSSCGHPRPYSKKSHHFFHGKSNIDNGEGGLVISKAMIPSRQFCPRL